MHEEIIQAKKDFYKLWPNEEFFARFTFPGAEEDEDAAILKSIVGEAQKQTPSTQQTEFEENDQIQNENFPSTESKDNSTTLQETTNIESSDTNGNTPQMVTSNVAHHEHILTSDSVNHSSSQQFTDEKNV